MANGDGSKSATMKVKQTNDGTKRNSEPKQQQIHEETESRNLRNSGDQSNLTNSLQSDAVSDQQPQNDGSYHFPVFFAINIERYEGETSEGLYHGEGVAHLHEGHEYKGTFSKGSMHGHGIFKWADGVKYEGEFVCCVPMGRGTYDWPDGSSYKGEVYNAIRHGTGTHKCATTGEVYKGQWHQGKRHGEGTIYYNQEETSWYKGDWVSNNREGRGVRRYATGNVYSGEWKSNERHGEGTMKWLKLGQQYVGPWQNGVQHGRGTHTWFLRRMDGSQYQQRNEYRGDFDRGQRHGHGTFHYAGGARYEGQWKDDQKHGKGKFIFRNGHSFEAEFVDGQMVTPDLWGNGAHTPCGAFPLRVSDDDASVLGQDMALDIGSVLEKIPERQQDAQRKQVEFVVLRHNTELRSMYGFYSRLGHAQSPDNTFLLSRLQLWRLLKDCNVHHHGMTLTQIDHFIREDVAPAETHSLFTAVPLCKLLSCLVVIAYHVYHKDMVSSTYILAACFDKLMKDNILPNANKVKGFLFSQPACAVVALSYFERCLEVYQLYCRVSPAPSADRTMTYRHLLWILKDLRLLDGNLTAVRVIEIMTSESRDPSNLSSSLGQEITFLEFFEVLLGCAEVKCQQEIEGQVEGQGQSQSQSSQDTEAGGVLPEEEDGDGESATLTTSCHSQEVEAPVNSPNTPEISSTKSVEMRNSSDVLQLPTCEDAETQQDLNTAVCKSQSAEHIEESGRDETCVQHIAEDRERGPELSAQRIHRFLGGLFFPAFNRRQLVGRKMKEWRILQETERCASLAIAQERARLREQQEEEEERRQNEEDEKAEEAAGEEEAREEAEQEEAGEQDDEVGSTTEDKDANVQNTTADISN